MAAAAVPYLMAASVALQVHSARQASGAADVDAEMARRDEELSSNEREIANKKRLIASLAQQNVEGAAGGVQTFGGGSRENMINVSHKEGKKEELTTQVMKQGRLQNIENRRINVKRQVGTRLAGSLIDTGTSYAKRGKTKKD